MSKAFLENINGGKNGRLKKYIDRFDGVPRIAWYPSAGTDFRALLYLHPNYSKLNPPTDNEPTCPDIFLFTDYFPWKRDRFLDSSLLFSDGRTSITVEYIEELPRLNLPIKEELVRFPEGSEATDRAIFLTVRVVSDKLGNYTFPVIYAFAVNETFYCSKMAPLKAVVSHIIHIRYGGGLGGGGKAAGAWLLNVLLKLRCELFISDGHHYWQSGDKFAMESCSEIPRECEVQLNKIRTLDSTKWSDHGDVDWNLVTPK